MYLGMYNYAQSSAGHSSLSRLRLNFDDAEVIVLRLSEVLLLMKYAESRKERYVLFAAPSGAFTAR